MHKETEISKLAGLVQQEMDNSFEAAALIYQLVGEGVAADASGECARLHSLLIEPPAGEDGRPLWPSVDLSPKSISERHNQYSRLVVLGGWTKEMWGMVNSGKRRMVAPLDATRSYEWFQLAKASKDEKELTARLAEAGVVKSSEKRRLEMDKGGADILDLAQKHWSSAGPPQSMSAFVGELGTIILDTPLEQLKIVRGRLESGEGAWVLAVVPAFEEDNMKVAFIYSGQVDDYVKTIDLQKDLGITAMEWLNMPQGEKLAFVDQHAPNSTYEFPWIDYRWEMVIK